MVQFANTELSRAGETLALAVTRRGLDFSLECIEDKTHKSVFESSLIFCHNSVYQELSGCVSLSAFQCLDTKPVAKREENKISNTHFVVSIHYSFPSFAFCFRILGPRESPDSPTQHQLEGV